MNSEYWILKSKEQLERSLIIGFLLLGLVSCKSGFHINRNDILPIDKELDVTIENVSNTVIDQHSKVSKSTVTGLFELKGGSSDTVNLRFTGNNELLLIYRDTLGVRTDTFYGEFKKGLYYEVYLRNNVVEIPPIIPIIHGSRNISRLRVFLLRGNQIVIEHKWARDANFLIMAGGGSGRSRSDFKILDK